MHLKSKGKNNVMGRHVALSFLFAVSLFRCIGQAACNGERWVQVSRTRCEARLVTNHFERDHSFHRWDMILRYRCLFFGVRFCGLFLCNNLV